MEITSDKFSTREWLLTITLLLGLEAVLFHLSYAAQDQESVISYISFAATVASLLLAVLAIIYGFVQSFSQQESASALASQLREMRGVQGELDTASSTIGSQVVTISASVSQLQQLSQTVSEAREAIDDLKGGISGLREDNKTLLTSVASLNDKIKSEAGSGPAIADPTLNIETSTRILFRQSSFQADLMAVTLVGLQDKRGGVAENWTEFIRTHYSDPVSRLGQHPGEASVDFVSGVTILLTARAFGIVVFRDGARPDDPYVVSVNPDAVPELRVCADKCRRWLGTREAAQAIDASFV